MLSTRLSDESVVTPKKRDLLRRIVEILDELEKLEEEYSELEEQYEKMGATPRLAAERVLRAPATPPAPSPAAVLPAAASLLTRAQRVAERKGKPPKGDEARALFRKRDQLRLDLWVAMLSFGRVRRRLVEHVFEEVPEDVGRTAARIPAPSRDAALAERICAEPQKKVRQLVSEVLAEADLQAPKTAARIRSSWEKVLTIENHLITRNMRLARHLAHKYLWSNHTLEDLSQAGFEGLQIAVERFDVERGFAFSTFGSYWVRHKIQRFAENGALVRIPVHVQILAPHVKKAVEAGKTVDEIAAETGKKRGAVVRALQARAGHVSLNAPVRGHEDTVLDFLADESPDAAQLVEGRDLHAYVEELLDQLEPRLAHVLRGRAQGRTFKEIGESLGLSNARIQQLETVALDKVRALMRTHQAANRRDKASVQA